MGAPKTIINKLASKLDELNIEDYRVRHSVTDFGNSSYIYVSGLKIRASGHGTGMERMLSEVPLFDLNFDSVLALVERLNYPENFKKVTRIVYGNCFEMKTEKLDTLYCEYKIEEHNYRISKRGHKMSLIRKLNVEEIYYLRN